MIIIKITIDTKEDSKEEISRAIQLLSSLVEGRIGSSIRNSKDLFSSTRSESAVSKSSESGNAFANMFGSGESSGESGKSEDKVMDFNSFADLVSSKKERENEKEEEDEEVPRIVSY